MTRARAFSGGLAALAILAVAGCAPPASEPPAPAPPPGKAPPIADAPYLAPNIDWHTRLAGDAVRLELIDPASDYRVERVVLHGPDGQKIPARELTRTNEPGPVGPSYGVGGGFGSRSGGGVGFGMSVPLAASHGTPERRTFALIPLPDPALYRRTAKHWTIQVTLHDADGTPYHATIPAPLP